MISIYGQINSANIDRKKWEAVFEDCKKIAEAGQLADIESLNVRGEELECLVPVKEKEGKLHIVGDLVQGRCVQDCELERDVTKYVLKGVKPMSGIPVSEHLYMCFYNGNSEYEKYFVPYFDTETFGSRPHIYLLAMAVLITSEFPEAAVVYGDITQGQCEEACRLIKEVTGKDAQMPIQYDYIRLFDAFRDFGYTGIELLDKFLTTYKGVRTEEVCQLLKSTFFEEEFTDYFNAHSADVFGLVKEWLELGLSPEGLCGAYKKLWKGSDAKQLVDYLILGKVHVKEKTELELYDFTIPSEGIADTSAMANARKTAGNMDFRRRIINAYIPLEDMKAVIKKHFPNENIDKFFADALAGKGRRFDKQRFIELMYSVIGEDALKMDERNADIIDPEKLYMWEGESTTIDEYVIEEMKEVLRLVLLEGKQIIERHRFSGRADREEYIKTHLINRIALPVDVAESIIDRAGEEDSTLYFGLIGTTVFDFWVSPIVNAVLMNPKLYDYVLKILKEDIL